MRILYDFSILEENDALEQMRLDIRDSVGKKEESSSPLSAIAGQARYSGISIFLGLTRSTVHRITRQMNHLSQVSRQARHVVFIPRDIFP